MKSATTRAALAALLGTVLSACMPSTGDEGTGGSGGGDGGGGGGGKVASATTASIPGHTQNTGYTTAYATNRGLYLLASDDAGERVLKLHGNPSFSNAWSTANFPQGLYDFAPVNVYSERDREVSFYYIDNLNWGLYTANTGSPSFAAEDDMYISRVAAGGREGTITPRPWVIAGGVGGYNRDYQYVWQDDGGYTASNKASDRFGVRAGDQIVVDEGGGILSDPRDPRLYVGAGNVLDVYSPTRLESRQYLPQGSSYGYITQLLWYDQWLWFAYDNTIYRRNRQGTIEAFMTFDSPFGSVLPGRFCITNGRVYTTDGLAKSVATGQVHDWIASGSDTAESAILRARLSPGIFCSPENTGNAIYVLSNDGTITMINPL